MSKMPEKKKKKKGRREGKEELYCYVVTK
jgi:hypothetical protein